MKSTRFANNNNNTSAGRHSNNNGGRREGAGSTAGSRSTNQGASKSNPASSSHRGGETTHQPMPTSPKLDSLEGLDVTPNSTVPIIDPTGFGGLIQVPVTKTFDTKGRSEYFKGILRKEVSLCCLFQKGRCHAGDKCHQIHVDTTFIKNVRAQNAHIISCCRACKDTASLSSTAVAFFASHFEAPTLKIVAPDGRFNVVRSDNLAYTTGLVQHVEQQQQLGAPSVTSLPIKKMCRLHLRGACKYGKDCKNIHLCTKLGEDILSPNNTPAPEERRGSVSNTSNSKQSSRTPTPTPAQHHQRGVSGIMDRVATPPPRAVSPAPLATAPSQKKEEESTRRASIVSIDDVEPPKDYFNSSRFATPEQKSVQALSRSDSLEQSTLQTPPPASAEDEEGKNGGERRLSFSQVDLSNVSFMENSVAMNGLCFDPTMALQTSAWDGFDFAPKHQPKKLSAEWLVDDLCGCSSTASQSATPTPAKAIW